MKWAITLNYWYQKISLVLNYRYSDTSISRDQVILCLECSSRLIILVVDFGGGGVNDIITEYRKSFLASH